MKDVAESIRHIEESSPRVQSMKKKRALQSCGTGRVLTLNIQWTKFIFSLEVRPSQGR